MSDEVVKIEGKTYFSVSDWVKERKEQALITKDHDADWEDHLNSLPPGYYE